MNMTVSWRPRGSAQRYLLPAGLVALSLWLTSLSVESWTYVHRVAGQSLADTLATTPVEKVLPAPLDDQNIAKAFGAVSVEFDSSPVSEPLKLLASMQGNQPEQSRALIQYADTAAFYSPGDRLPDGARLKSIGNHEIVVMRAGREHYLLLPGRELRLLKPQGTLLKIAARKSTTLLQAIENTP
ncbi:general secretion pathway protein C [Pseudomonas lurida]|jgi:general secretion pathway protein C|nr:general secretion pathway protein C [Pseudomonas lurida]